MRKILLIFSVLIFVNISAQRSLMWEKNFGSYTSNEFLTIDQGDNIFLASAYSSVDIDIDPGPSVHTLLSSEIYNFYVAKFDPTGDFVWAKSWNNQYPLTIEKICTDMNDNVFITGRFQDTVDLDPGPGVAQFTSEFLAIYLIKLDNDGNFLWAEAYPAFNHNWVNEVVADGNGNIYLGGKFRDSMQVVTADFDTLKVVAEGTFLNDAYILKVNENGTPLWIYQYGGGLTADEVLSLSIDSDDNVVFGGIFSDTTDFDPGPGICEWGTTSAQHPCYGKLNPNGDLIYCGALFPTNGGNSITKVLVDQEDNIILTGTYNGVCDFDSGPDSVFLPHSNFHTRWFVLKLDDMGGFEWVKTFGLGNSHDPIWDMALTKTNGLFLVGSFQDSLDLNPGVISDVIIVNDSVSLNNYDGYCVELNADGEFLWGGRTTSSGTNAMLQCEVNSSNKIYLTLVTAGYSEIDPSPVVYESNMVETRYHLLQLDGFVGVGEEVGLVQNFTVVPNPSTAKFTVQFNESQERIELSILDAQGRLVSHEKLNNIMSYEVNLSGFQKGLYYLKIQLDGEQYIEKLIKL